MCNCICINASVAAEIRCWLELTSGGVDERRLYLQEVFGKFGSSGDLPMLKLDFCRTEWKSVQERESPYPGLFERPYLQS